MVCINKILFCFSLLLGCILGQSLNVTQTYPVGLEGANPLVSAVEGSKNVTILCEITIDGIVTITQWSLIAESDQVVTFLSFTVDGRGQENFVVTPLAENRRNFTILTFNKSLDNTQIGCGVSGTILVRFDLKLISKYCNEIIEHCL